MGRKRCSEGERRVIRERGSWGNKITVVREERDIGEIKTGDMRSRETGEG